MLRNRLGRIAWRLFTVAFAFTYFAFRVELFSEEAERNKPATDAFPHQVCVAPQSLNWETFDKDNAPKAVVVQPHFTLELLFLALDEPVLSLPLPGPREIIRDKSPPNRSLHAL